MANAEVQLSDHREVLKTLKNCDPAAKCFYTQSGVLLERTVKEIFPLVVMGKEKLEKEIENLRLRIEEKTREVDQFRITFNVQILSEEQSLAA
ncbi:prefoldin subunit 2-like isoform X2 [Argiope bruennichi]|nr:prefoldin subunit 2-like isoform X2 [Argiope bruennichi]